MTLLELRRLLRRQLRLRARRVFTMARGITEVRDGDQAIRIEYDEEFPSVWARAVPGFYEGWLRRFRDYCRERDRS